MMHYTRLRRTGTLERKRPIIYTCTLEGCATAHFARGLCEMHYARLKRQGDPAVRKHGGRAPGATPPEAHYNWQADSVSYDGAHMRVAAARGTAKRYACVDCHGPALHWSYDHRDPAPKFDERRRLLYSPAVEHYEPRCAKCHKAFDVPRAR